MRVTRCAGFVLFAVAVVTVIVITAVSVSAAVVIAATGDAAAPTAFAPPDTTLRDLGISAGLSDSRRLWAFGDTFEPGADATKQSSVHSSTAALSEAATPGTLAESKDLNRHRNTFLPPTAGEAAFSGQRFRTYPPQRVYDSRGGDGPLASGLSRNIVVPLPVDVTGHVPDRVRVSALINLTGINSDPSAGSLLTVSAWTNGATSTSTLNLKNMETAANLVTAPLSVPTSNWGAQQNTVTITAAGVPTDFVIDLFGIVTELTTDSQYVPISPTRAYDTTDASCRGSNLGVDTTSAPIRLKGNGCEGATNVPADATAVAINLTADGTGSAGGGFMTAYQDGTARTISSNLNMAPYDIHANMAVVPLSALGDIRLYNATGSFRAIVDIVGYLTTTPSAAAAKFVPLQPVRACDSRDITYACYGTLGAGDPPRTVQLPRTQIPEGATAAVLNVTAIQPSTSTFMRVWAAGALAPTTSMANTLQGHIRASMMISPISAGGAVSVYNAAGNVNFVIDVVGFVAPPVTTVGVCPAGSDLAPRIAIWPTSILTVGGAVLPATERVVVYYQRLVACKSTNWLWQDVGVAYYDYQANQPTSQPMQATRAAIPLGSSADGTFPSGAFVFGGLVKDNFAYLYGCDLALNSCRISRIANNWNSMSALANYEYWAPGGYGTHANSAAMSFSGVVPDAEAPGTMDISVQWIATWGATGSYVMMYAPKVAAAKPIIIRTADNPQGPWTVPVKKADNTTPKIPGCTAAGSVCRALHINPDLTSKTQIWFSFFTQSPLPQRNQYTTLPISGA